jgi:hypothetical protein
MKIVTVRRKAALFSAMALAPLLFVYGACSSNDDGAGARKLHLTMTSKGSVQSFLNRFATPDGQLVATRAPLGSDVGKESIVVSEEPGERLHVVELDAAALKGGPLPGERGRIGTFAVVAVPAGTTAHELIGNHMMYAEALALTEQKATSLRRALPGKVGRGGGAMPPSLLDFDPQEIERFAPTVNVDRAFLEQKTKEISGAVPVTIDGRTVTISERRSETGRNNVRAWLKQEYEGLGYTVSEHAYGSGLSAGKNFVAERVGADPNHFVLLTAHLDNVGNAGADDDGAGTVSVLAIAHAIADLPLAIGVRVIGFDQEESGLIGSKAYARAQSTAGTLDQIVGVLNVEMTGYDADNDGAFHAIHCNENTSAEISARIAAALTREPLALRIVNACTNRSDHAAFWTYDVPAIVVSQNFFGGDSNPCYHASCDRVDRMNFDYMTRVTKAMAIAVAEWVAE